MTAEESHNNYLTHSWKSEKANPHESDEQVVFCAECGIENQGDPNEFDWLEYPSCQECRDVEPFAVDWTRKCEVCGETPVVNQTGLCGPCTFGEAETAGGNW